MYVKARFRALGGAFFTFLPGGYCFGGQVAVRSGTQETSERVASCLEALLKGSA